MEHKPRVAVLRGASFLEARLAVPADSIDIALDTRFDYDGLARLDGSRAEVIVLDLRGLRGSPVAPMAAVRAASPEARLVVVGTAGDEKMAQAALGSGACGYVSRDASPQAILDAVNSAARGAMRLSGTARRAVVSMCR